MQTAFAEAMLGGRHRVFGYDLQPFSAAHLAFLEAVDSPIFSVGESIGADQLLLAARVCASPVRLIRGGYLPDVGKLAPTLLDSIRLGLICASPAKFAKQVAAFRTYLDDYLASPEKYDTPNKKPRPMSSPTAFALVVQGAKIFGEERAWSMPFGLLRTYMDVYAESEGAEVRFTPDEADAEEIEKQLAAADEEGRKLAERIRKTTTRK